MTAPSALACGSPARGMASTGRATAPPTWNFDSKPMDGLWRIAAGEALKKKPPSTFPARPLNFSKPVANMSKAPAPTCSCLGYEMDSSPSINRFPVALEIRAIPNPYPPWPTARSGGAKNGRGHSSPSGPIPMRAAPMAKRPCMPARLRAHLAAPKSYWLPGPIPWLKTGQARPPHPASTTTSTAAEHSPKKSKRHPPPSAKLSTFANPSPPPKSRTFRRRANLPPESERPP